jgi:hypothetical protein
MEGIHKRSWRATPEEKISYTTAAIFYKAIQRKISNLPGHHRNSW